MKHSTLSPRRAANAMLLLLFVALIALFFAGCKKDPILPAPRAWPPRLHDCTWRVDSLIDYDRTRFAWRYVGLDRDTFAIYGEDSARYSIYFARVFRGRWKAIEWENNTWLYTLYCPDTALLFIVDQHTETRLVLCTLDQREATFSDVLYLSKAP